MLQMAALTSSIDGGAKGQKTACCCRSRVKERALVTSLLQLTADNSTSSIDKCLHDLCGWSVIDEANVSVCCVPSTKDDAQPRALRRKKQRRLATNSESSICQFQHHSDVTAYMRDYRVTVSTSSDCSLSDEWSSGDVTCQYSLVLARNELQRLGLVRFIQTPTTLTAGYLKIT